MSRKSVAPLWSLRLALELRMAGAGHGGFLTRLTGDWRFGDQQLDFIIFERVVWHGPGQETLVMGC